MTTSNTIDAARLELLLTELRLPGIKLMWAKLAAQSGKEGWPAARFLAALAGHELADRGRRRKGFSSGQPCLGHVAFNAPSIIMPLGCLVLS